ncbi:hypothetical protein Xkhy_05230 [Xanthomonas axonopodis pv. khayae]|nr:hypothetical protein Xkhy_05230 [Xanthomonas axonopodis pv. khayae]
MLHRERKHRLLILDFEQQRIATGAEANHQFTLERFVLANFTTAQRCHFKYGDSITRELQSALGHSKISPSPLQQIAVEPRKIITRLLGKTDVKRTLDQLLRASSSWDCSPASTSFTSA